MLSVDIIFIGGRRVFVIEIIDPAQIKDENLTTHYEKMRAWKPETDKMEQMAVDMEWSKNIVTDFSIHVRSDRTKDDLLFEIYQSYLNTYVDMAKQAESLNLDLSRKVLLKRENFHDQS